MKEKDPLYLLFEHDFGSGPLFKNQIELVNELISDPDSSFFTSDEETIKALRIRLKTYFSQLLSDSIKRNVNPQLVNSLRVLLKKKIFNKDYGNLDDLHSLIIEGLREKNSHIVKEGITPVYSGNANFVNDIINAKNIAIFTAREIRLEFDIYNKKMSLVEFLFDDLMNALKENKSIKLYRFNFPRKETCILFWRGLHKELTSFLKTDKRTFLSMHQLLMANPLNNKDMLAKEANENSENALAALILNFLSVNKKICVFQSSAPVFTLPTIVMNPNDFTTSKAYVMYLDDKGKDQIHKLGYADIHNWQTFVWENLKINSTLNTLIQFAESMR